jgi:hypothetical protein
MCDVGMNELSMYLQYLYFGDSFFVKIKNSGFWLCCYLATDVLLAMGEKRRNDNIAWEWDFLIWKIN